MIAPTKTELDSWLIVWIQLDLACVIGAVFYLLSPASEYRRQRE